MIVCIVLLGLRSPQLLAQQIWLTTPTIDELRQSAGIESEEGNCLVSNILQPFRLLTSLPSVGIFALHY
jgi:hypothetical protein